MSSGFVIVFGAILACMLVAQAQIAAKEKNPGREFVIGAIISVVTVGVVAWLTHWIVSWMLETGLIVAFLIIGFGFLCLWLLIGAVGAVADLVNRRD